MADNKNPVCSAVIVAAGSGSRMKQNVNKVYLDLLSHPVIYYSIAELEKSPYVSDIVIVTRDCDIAECEKIVNDGNFKKVKCVISGGATRTDSVENGVNALGDCDYVLVHDGARPMISQDIIERAVTLAFEGDGAISAMPVKDTIKIADSGQFIENTPERAFLYIAQTPQVIKRDVLLEGYSYIKEHNLSVTDDASVAEAIGKKIALAEGSYENIKITTPEDMEFAEKLLLR